MKILVLAGSGEFTSAMDETDAYLLNIHSKAKNFNNAVAIIPTAAGKEKQPESWIDDGIRHFLKLDAKPFGLRVLNKSDAFNKKNLAKAGKASFFYFSGGNPGYLNSTIRETLLWELILSRYKKGSILAGSSAGAMIMGNMVLANAQEAFEKGERPFRWVKATGLVGFAILPHFDWAQKNKSAILQELFASAPNKVKNKWIGIDENTALIISDGKKVKVMGFGLVRISFNGKISEYKAGDSFKL